MSKELIRQVSLAGFKESTEKQEERKVPGI